MRNYRINQKYFMRAFIMKNFNEGFLEFSMRD